MLRSFVIQSPDCGWEATSIQYQKRLRQLEARRIMTKEGDSAKGSAYKVGYSYASQVSGEYSRMFGSPPLRASSKIKATGLAPSAI